MYQNVKNIKGEYNVYILTGFCQSIIDKIAKIINYAFDQKLFVFRAIIVIKIRTLREIDKTIDGEYHSENSRTNDGGFNGYKKEGI